VFERVRDQFVDEKPAGNCRIEGELDVVDAQVGGDRIGVDVVGSEQVPGEVADVVGEVDVCQPLGLVELFVDQRHRADPVLAFFKDGEGLRVVGVSVDRNLRNARGFLRRVRVSFPIVHDARHQVAGRDSPETMPTSYVIDRRGVVRHVHRGFRSGDARRLEREVRALLSQRARRGRGRR